MKLVFALVSGKETIAKVPDDFELSKFMDEMVYENEWIRTDDYSINIRNVERIYLEKE